MSKLMSEFRATPLQNLNGQPVTALDDFKTGIRRTADGQKKPNSIYQLQMS